MYEFNLKATLNVNIENIRKQIKENCLDLLTALEVSDKEIDGRFDLFLSYIDDNKSCKNCLDISTCPHSNKGYKTKIFRDNDGFLSDSLVVCNKYKEIYEKLKKIDFSTFDNNLVVDKKNLAFLKTNLSLIDNESKQIIIDLLSNKKVKGAFLSIEDSKSRKNIILGLSYKLLDLYNVSICNFQNLIYELKEKYNVLNYELFDKIKNSPVLLIDDLGNETINTFSRDEVLLPLLDYRLSNDLVTIILSQYKYDDFRNIYKIAYNDGPKAKLVSDKIKELIKEN